MPEVQDAIESRRFERQDISIEVVVRMKGCAPMTITTGNISVGGVFLQSDGRDMPKLGEEIGVTLPEFIGSHNPVSMRAVVRHSSAEGVSIEFLGVLE